MANRKATRKCTKCGKRRQTVRSLELVVLGSFGQDMGRVRYGDYCHECYRSVIGWLQANKGKPDAQVLNAIRFGVYHGKPWREPKDEMPVGLEDR